MVEGATTTDGAPFEPGATAEASTERLRSLTREYLAAIFLAQQLPDPRQSGWSVSWP